MNKIKLLCLGAALVFSLSAGGCVPKSAASAQEAIEQSKSKGSVQQQVDYLTGQANAFINNKNYDQAMAVANHILSDLDKNSDAARKILEKAKEDMHKAAQGAVDEMKKSFGNMGK